MGGQRKASEGEEQTADKMGAVGKEELLKADKMEVAGRMEEDRDRVEGMLVADRSKADKFEEDKPTEGRVELDREKQVSQGKLVEGYPAGRIDREASQKQWGYLLGFY